MSRPVLHLPVVQNWDCHGCTACCHEYHVPVTDEERQRIVGQGWHHEADFAGRLLFVHSGLWWARRYRLNHRPDGACVFLNEQGRCRIHERFGSEAKPLACRLYPFVLVPAGDHWRVGLRYACPSAAGNQGRRLSEHARELQDHADELARTSGGEMPLPPPPLQGRQRVDWPDLLHFAEAIQKLLRERGAPLERRWRKVLALAALCRQARFDKVRGSRLVDFLKIVGGTLEDEVEKTAEEVPPPTWVGRVLFRLTAALYLRKDTGPDRGLAGRGRLALFRAACRFAAGAGSVPRVHARLPQIAFEQLEKPCGPLPEAVEEQLERYYLVKIDSLQFCGPTNFHQAFWDGVESLAVTLPVILWLARAFAELPREDAIAQAVRIVDYNFGFNRFLGGARQRWSANLLASRGELARLIAWYSR